MGTPMTPATDLAAAGHTSIEDLLDRAADLKGELVAFAQGTRFERRLRALLCEAADPLGYLDEAVAVRAIDHFALQRRLSGGRTVVELFVAQRRPKLSDGEREMVLGWRDVVEGCFEVSRLDGAAVELRNLLDDLVYRVYSNIGPAAFAKLRKGMFVLCRVVPIHPAVDAWLISGHLTMFPKSAGREIALAAARELTGHPELLRRNPAMLEQAWKVQAEHRAEFIAQVGSDLVVLPPVEARETLREHYRRIRDRAVAKLDGKAAKRATNTGPTPEDMVQFWDELLAADTVALIYDEIEGLTIFRDFGHVDSLFANPELARDRTNLARLRDWLHDESVTPLAFRLLAQRHPDGADPVFRALLRRPGFSWSRDGETLLRRHKKSFFDREPLPSISIVGERLTELLRGSR
ncbi:MAG TPA: hypothetical protein VFX16_03755 [Pseudonocardiaceae bacterium]|nr:hypothetical protein [Pseudonocardiaceae bacterium]